MSDHVWVSDAWNDSALILFVQTDISVSHVDKSVEGLELNKAGKPVPADLCPTKIWGDEAAPHFETMPHLFLAMGQWIVSAKAADVLRRFDLGGGALYPVSGGVYQKDGVTAVPGTYYCWTFGNAKRAFDETASVNMEEPVVSGLWWTMPWNIADDDVAVTSEALQGPAVWLDAGLFKSIFVSGPLGDALAAAGLTRDFRLHRCRVI